MQQNDYNKNHSDAKNSYIYMRHWNLQNIFMSYDMYPQDNYIKMLIPILQLITI